MKPVCLVTCLHTSPPLKKKRKANLQLGPPSPAPHSLCAGWGVQGCLACSAQQNISLLLCWRELEFSTSSNAQRRSHGGLVPLQRATGPQRSSGVLRSGFRRCCRPEPIAALMYGHWCSVIAVSQRQKRKKKHVKENAKGTVPFENHGRVWTLKCDASVLKSGCRLSKQYRKCLPQNWIYFLNFWLNDVLII